MIRDILEIVGFIIIVILLLLEIYACVLSRKISEEERRNDKKRIDWRKQTIQRNNRLLFWNERTEIRRTNR